jgi:hypothetical protein
MSSLTAKMQRSRETAIKVDRFTFTVRRPTVLEMVESGGKFTPRMLFGCLVGWEGVTQADLIPGGDPHPAEFDAQDCAEWLADSPHLLLPLMKAAVDAHQGYSEKLDAALKNSPGG